MSRLFGLFLIVCHVRANIHHPLYPTTTKAQYFKEQVDLGTTLVAVRYDLGVVVAADSRTSVGGFVSNRYAHKLDPITSHCTVLRSGSAADTQAVANACRLYFRERALRHGVQPTVAQIAHWMRTAVLEMSDGQVSLLVAGVDPETDDDDDDDDNDDRKKEPTGSIYSVAMSGAVQNEGNYAAAGSGSVFILGHLDHEIKETNKVGPPLLTQEQAIQLCRHAISLAASRDGSSGGVIRMRVIDRDGTKELLATPAIADDTSNMALSKNLPGFAQPFLQN